MKSGPPASSLPSSPSPDPTADPAVDAPCAGCGHTRVLRQFSLDPALISVNDHDVARPAPDVTEEIGDGEVTVTGAAGTVHVLNASAALIWLSLDGRSTIADIVGELHQETGVASDVLGPDVHDAVARFVASGLALIDR